MLTRPEVNFFAERKEVDAIQAKVGLWTAYVIIICLNSSLKSEPVQMEVEDPG